MNETQKAQYIAQRNLKPYNGDLPYIFISYAHLDWREAMLIVERLMHDGYRVWFDEGIDPGTEWGENIAGHVEHCKVFIALISKNYLNSGNCLNELEYSRKKNRQRILVYLEKVELSGALDMQHSRFQAVHKYTYQKEEGFYAKLYEGKILKECREPSRSIDTLEPVETLEDPSGQHGKFPVKPIAIAAIVVAGVFAAIILLTGRSGSGDSGTDDSVSEESGDGLGTTEEEQLAEDDDSGESVEELAEETIEEEIVATRTGDSEAEQDEQKADGTLDESEDADLSEAGLC